MKHISLLVVFSMLLTFCHTYAAENIAEVNSVIDFSDTQRDMSYFVASRDGAVSITSGYDGDCLAVKCFDKMSDGESAKLVFQKANRTLRITQTVNVVASETADISIMADDTSVLKISFEDYKIKVLSKNGLTELQSFQKGSWYTITADIDISSGTCYVFVNGIQKGGVFELYRNVGYANNVKYSVSGKGEGRINIDDILISTKGIKNLVASDDGTTVNGALPTMRPYPNYKIPENGVESTGVVGDEVVWASSSEEGSEYQASNVFKKDNSAWHALSPSEPKDNGKSLKISKPLNGATQTAIYTVEPVEGICVVEYDFITGENTGQKALPYIYDSTGKHVLSILLNEKNFFLAGPNRVLLGDFLTDHWYSVRYEINTYTKTADIYLDDVLLLEAISFRDTTARDVAKLQFHIASNFSGSVFVDNVRVYKKTTLGNTIDVYSNDFEGQIAGSTAINGWQTEQGSGFVGIERYSFSGVNARYPQALYVDMTREGLLEKTEIVFPENTNYKYDIATSRNGNDYVTVAEHLQDFCSGMVTDAFSPLKARYIRITFYAGIDNNGNQVGAKVQNLNAFWFKRNVDGNIAFTANITTSSNNTSIYDERGLNDNIVAEFGNIGEWQSAGEKYPKASFSWNEPHAIDRIIIHDRANLDSHIKNGRLDFSDGTSIDVTDIPNSGAPKDITFDAKTVTWVSFTATAGEGDNPGLSEMQIFETGATPDLPEYIEPWKIVKLDTAYGGRWLVADDINNDGEVDIVTARTTDEGGSVGAAGKPYYDRHEVTSIAVQNLDGDLLWTWGEPNLGKYDPGYDVPCIIYDLDNNGTKEILFCTRDTFHILDGVTGKEITRHTLPVSPDFPYDWASDCINIANISGNDYPSDIIIKTRYTDIWAFTKDWEELWHVEKINGYRTAHQPWVIDIDNDGYDEVLSSYSLIDNDGSVVWSLSPSEFASNIPLGHQDSIKAIVFDLIGDVDKSEVINKKDLDLLNSYLAGEADLNEEQKRNADTDGNGLVNKEDAVLLEKRVNNEIKAFPNKGLAPEDIRLCLCFCGAWDIAMIDGTGKRVWAAEDALHYETIIPADVILENEGIEIVTNPMRGDTAAIGNDIVFIFGQDGELLRERYGLQLNRYVQTFNWTGTEQDYIIMPTDNIITDGDFNIKVKPLSPLRAFNAIMSFSMPVGDTRYAGDMDGDGTTDINLLINTNDGGWKLYIYKNPNGRKIADAVGTGPNFSLY